MLCCSKQEEYKKMYTDRLIDNGHTTTILRTTCRISLIQISVCSTCFVYEYRQDFLWHPNQHRKAFF